MKGLRIACTALTKRIFAGRVNKAGNSFLDGKVDVTSDCLKAVIEHVEPGHTVTVHVDGVPKYEITVKAIAKEPSA